jgi:hypothetical protein
MDTWELPLAIRPFRFDVTEQETTHAPQTIHNDYCQRFCPGKYILHIQGRAT